MKIYRHQFIFAAAIYSILLYPFGIFTILEISCAVGLTIWYSYLTKKDDPPRLVHMCLMCIVSICLPLIISIYGITQNDNLELLFVFISNIVVVSIITYLFTKSIDNDRTSFIRWALIIVVTTTIMYIFTLNIYTQAFAEAVADINSDSTHNNFSYIISSTIVILIMNIIRMLIAIAAMKIANRRRILNERIQIMLKSSANQNTIQQFTMPKNAYYVMYCPQCAQTGANIPDVTKHPEYYKGYIYTQNKKEQFCEYCGTLLQNTGMSWEEVDAICKASNANRKTLEMLIELKRNNKIEYNEKFQQLINSITQ